MSSTARDYYLAQPMPLAQWVALHRQALTLLRPELATIWLDTDPGSQGWPAEASAAADRAVARASTGPELGDPTARRRGTHAGTLILNPCDEQDFALALSLAPFTLAVEGVSGAGQLVYARIPGGGGLRLRLTRAERAELQPVASAKVLAHSSAPEPGSQAPARTRLNWFSFLFFAVAFGWHVIGNALPGVKRGSVGAILVAAVGVAVILMVGWPVGSQVWRRYRTRGRSDPTVQWPPES